MRASKDSIRTHSSEEHFYLTCEKYYIFELLTFAAGMLGAYTYNLRGGVFCNAQTANVVLMAMAFGQGQFGRGFYFLIPITAYVGAAFVSEYLPVKVRKMDFLRWDTYLVGFEILIVFLLGFMPLSWPVQIAQVSINFICSMQYNTFRQAEGIPMATTFVTNHVRQVGVGLANYHRKRDRASLERLKKHGLMLVSFFAGGLILTLFCGVFKERVIWLAILPFAVSFVLMVHADLSGEHSLLGRKSRGH